MACATRPLSLSQDGYINLHLLYQLLVFFLYLMWASWNNSATFCRWFKLIKFVLFRKIPKMIAFLKWSEYTIYSHGLQLKMYKSLYSGNPLCCPVTRLPNLLRHGPPVLLDSCIALQIYFIHMQGNKLYIYFTFFFLFLVAAFTVTINISKMSVAFTKKLLLVSLWVNWGSAGSSWSWLGLSQICHTCLLFWAPSWGSSGSLGLLFSWQMAEAPEGLAKIYDMIPLNLLLANGALLFLMPLVKVSHMAKSRVNRLEKHIPSTGW